MKIPLLQDQHDEIIQWLKETYGEVAVNGFNEKFGLPSPASDHEELIKRMEILDETLGKKIQLLKEHIGE